LLIFVQSKVNRYFGIVYPKLNYHRLRWSSYKQQQIMSAQHVEDGLSSHGDTIRSDLLERLSNEARIFLPSDEDRTNFDFADLRFTQYERPTYIAIVEPSCENDVIEVVKYAREREIPFTPRGGHHAVTSTMRRFQDGICINMRPFNKMRWDAKQQHVTTGGGALTDEFVRFVHNLGMEVSEFVLMLQFECEF
jgi:hypothetical protein